MFECKVCGEKDLRLADKDAEIKRLVAQVQMLRELVYPTRFQTEVTLQSREMDQILSGEDQAIPLTDDEINNEASQILLGSYSSSQVDIE